LAEGRADILFTGHLSGAVLTELYSNAYLYVLPSQVEGLSMSLLEAMAHGLCVLASDIPENLVVIGEDLGFSFRSGDVKDLAATLRFLLDRPGVVRSTGERARERVMARYNWDRITSQILAVYRSVLVAS
jgi:glycosyltransferase involved in cell wall biosynthesis